MSDAAIRLSQPLAHVQFALDDLGPFATVEQLEALLQSTGGRPCEIDPRSFIVGMLAGLRAAHFGADK